MQTWCVYPLYAAVTVRRINGVGTVSWHHMVHLRGLFETYSGINMMPKSSCMLQRLPGKERVVYFLVIVHLLL